MTTLLSASVAIHSGLRKAVKSIEHWAHKLAEKAYDAADRDFSLKNQMASDLVAKAAEMKSTAGRDYHEARRAVTDRIAKLV